MGKHIDPAAAEALRELQSPGEPDLFERLKDIFLQSSEESLSTLKKFPSGLTTREVRDISHSWKNSSLAIGAKYLGDLCSKLDDAAAANDVSAILTLISQISSEYQAVKLELTN